MGMLNPLTTQLAGAVRPKAIACKLHIASKPSQYTFLYYSHNPLNNFGVYFMYLQCRFQSDDLVNAIKADTV